MIQKSYFGMGSIKHLNSILGDLSSRNIFLVTGRGSYKSCGAEQVLTDVLKSYNCERFYDFEVNPKLNDAVRGTKLFNEGHFDVLVAVGGGTVMDMAKLIKVFSSHDGNPEDYVKKKESVHNPGKPLVVIPTTAGSGSEATHFAVVYIDKTKYSLGHEFMLPEYSILDPQFTMNLPSGITASTGMDALSQAIESYWSVNSTEESKEYAKQAITLAIDNMVGAVNRSTEESRIRMMEAANLAGKAINISKTTASHAISYPMTSYFGVPHGHAVGLTLGEMLVFNAQVGENDVADSRGVGYVRNTIDDLVGVLGCSSPEDANSFLGSLMEQIKLSTRLNEVGIVSESDIDTVVKNGFNPERMKNNPRKINETQLRNILGKIS